jgi:hypothetical protein
MNCLKAIFWDYPELTDPDEIRRILMDERSQRVRRWLLKRFLEHGRVMDTLLFFRLDTISNDLDLFSLQQVNLSELGFWIRGLWPGESAVIKEAPHFLSCLILETKIDLVIDPLSIDEKHPIEVFENGHQLQIDTIQGIVSNKLSGCVSRTEPKDYVDLYAIFKKLPEIKLETVYAMAKKKDAIFDDPPTVAFQLEEGIALIKERPKIVPLLRMPFDYDEFFTFYEDLSMWVYKQLRP